MPPAKLFLWANVYPGAVLAGILCAWCVYWFAHPRPTKACGGVVAEAWRVYALAAAVPGLLVGAELYLWLLKFDYRAPVLLTNLLPSLGLVALAVAPVPTIVAACNRCLARPRPVAATTWLALTGVLLAIGGGALRDRTWRSVARAAEHEGTVHQVALLGAYGYAPIDAVAPVLDQALPAANDAVALARDWREEQLYLDRATRRYLASRLEEFQTAEHATTHGTGTDRDTGYATAAAVWWLTGDKQRALRAYELAADLPLATPADAASHALATIDSGDALDAHLGVIMALLAMVETEVGRVVLPPTLIAQLGQSAARTDDLGRTAVVLLFRDGARPSLRHVLPRFVDPDAPEWAIVLEHCPRRTHELVALASDDDQRVAAGARAVLSFVRQYCVSSAPVTG